MDVDRQRFGVASIYVASEAVCPIYVQYVLHEAATLPPEAMTEPSHIPHAAPTMAKRKRVYPKAAPLLALPSGRFAVGKRLREFKASLIAHLGGQPTAVQSALIDRAVALQHHLTALDRKTVDTGQPMSGNDTERYIALDMRFTRIMRQLGLEAAPPPKPKPKTPRQLLGLDPYP
jgi:hypothetical protein